MSAAHSANKLDLFHTYDLALRSTRIEIYLSKQVFL